MACCMRFMKSRRRYETILPKRKKNPSPLLLDRVGALQPDLWDDRMGDADGIWRGFSVYADSPVCSWPISLFVSDLTDNQAFS